MAIGLICLMRGDFIFLTFSGSLKLPAGGCKARGVYLAMGSMDLGSRASLSTGKRSLRLMIFLVEALCFSGLARFCSSGSGYCCRMSASLSL